PEDIVLEPENIDLDKLEFDDIDNNNESLQFSMLLQTSNQPLVKKKKFERLSSSPVKPFYKT
ncbi:10085_t:CDS:1, partial [Scutellospora calospora]